MEEKEQQLWSRQPDETQNAFAEFLAYLELGPDATLEQAAEKLGKSIEAVWKMSSRHQWLERAAGWRQHLAENACTAIVNTTKNRSGLWAIRAELFREQEWEAALKLGQAGRSLLNQYLTNAKGEKPLAAAWEVAKLLEVSSKLARLASSQLTGQQEGANEIHPDLLEAMKIAFATKPGAVIEIGGGPEGGKRDA